MRKFLILTLAAVLLAGMLVIPAAAEGNGAAALPDVTAKPGGTGILTLSLKDFGMANTIGVSFILPEGLTLDDEQSSWLLEGQLTDISGTQAAWAAVDAVDVDTDVLALAVNIPENAQEGDVFTVSCTVRVKNNKEVLGTADAEGRITVQVKHEHDYQETVFPPSCKEKGYTEYTCACGDSYRDDFTEPTGHRYDGDPDTRCSVCGELRTVPMFRMYDPNSGEHFYTGSDLERDFLVEAGWHYEGVGFNFPAEGAPVYRLYEPVHGEHLYTMNVAEKDKLISWGWNLEGVAFNTAGEDAVPQYRLHNPNAKRGGYHFTGSSEERDLLISLGWIDQGIGWFSCLE